jgi:hypothetical protein
VFFLFITFITLMKATQHMLRYLFSPLGPATDNELTQARMIADAAAGPLKAHLQEIALTDTATWNGLDTNEKLDFTVNIIPNGPTPPAASYLYTQSAGANVLQLASTAAGAVIVELRYDHSFVR